VINREEEKVIFFSDNLDRSQNWRNTKVITDISRLQS